MVSIESLIRDLVVPLVHNPDAVQITRREEERFMVFDLTVDAHDIGAVIGRGGQVIRAIRTVVYAAKSPYSKRVRLNVVDA
ncbi:KH domain-containing protein [Lacticaseibacillus thailandensis]|uniref:RNA-binding protein KhpA n=1 Tax=Lacticaseibacillus thailandensis DSM 22698 = JCM 13996 TaxID=1423810 RepID=A0A0R2CAU8_9LACO|nr:KH domain-containing protein [Lacticaseibacillus thailandensis]KRM88226.1 hypothetical protein FD19_GL000517 [Lacticaseibacillus thailandensis DSM 22698 = JCM 13996]